MKKKGPKKVKKKKGKAPRDFELPFKKSIIRF